MKTVLRLLLSLYRQLFFVVVSGACGYLIAFIGTSLMGISSNEILDPRCWGMMLVHLFALYSFERLTAKNAKAIHLLWRVPILLCFGAVLISGYFYFKEMMIPLYIIWGNVLVTGIALRFLRPRNFAYQLFLHFVHSLILAYTPLLTVIFPLISISLPDSKWAYIQSATNILTMVVLFLFIGVSCGFTYYYTSKKQSRYCYILSAKKLSGEGFVSLLSLYKGLCEKLRLLLILRGVASLEGVLPLFFSCFDDLNELGYNLPQMPIFMWWDMPNFSFCTKKQWKRLIHQFECYSKTEDGSNIIAHQKGVEVTNEQIESMLLNVRARLNIIVSEKKKRDITEQIEGMLPVSLYHKVYNIADKANCIDPIIFASMWYFSQYAQVLLKLEEVHDSFSQKDKFNYPREIIESVLYGGMDNNLLFGTDPKQLLFALLKICEYVLQYRALFYLSWLSKEGEENKKKVMIRQKQFQADILQPTFGKWSNWQCDAEADLGGDLSLQLKQAFSSNNYIREKIALPLIKKQRNAKKVWAQLCETLVTLRNMTISHEKMLHSIDQEFIVHLSSIALLMLQCFANDNHDLSPDSTIYIEDCQEEIPCYLYYKNQICLYQQCFRTEEEIIPEYMHSKSGRMLRRTDDRVKWKLLC